MKRYRAYIISLMAVVLLWMGCTNEGMNEPKQEVTFPLSICLPADEVYAARMGGPRRVMGDPGATEQFALPNYIYIIVMKKTGESTWALWRVITRTDVAVNEKWTKTGYVGLLQTMGDSVYVYNEEFVELLDPGEANFNGRVYAVASKEPLTFNKSLNSIENLDSLENLTFNTGSVQSDIQHIYSTPYNYEVNGDYYGSFSSSQKVPHVSLVLYHVAAKVDINWNVPDSARVNRAGIAPIRLTHMDACNLYAGDAYCFKPMKNKKASKVTTTDSVHIVTPSDEGLWWEGRSYFYTILYTTTSDEEKKGYFPLQMRMETNESGNMYTPTIYMKVDTTATFVPWMRSTFNIKKQLTAGSEDKIVDL